MVAKHVLWGDHIWNAGRWLAKHFDLNPHLVSGKRILELGAGVGLPSIIAILNNASSIIITDYPDQELIENLEHNVRTNIKEEELRKRTKCQGYLWGSSTSNLTLDGLFDVIILCDLVFNHSELSKLLQSSIETLSPSGTIWCVFTHHRPWLVDKDLGLLRMAEEAGLKCEKVAEYVFDSAMFEHDRGDPDVRRTVHAHTISYP